MRRINASCVSLFMVAAVCVSMPARAAKSPVETIAPYVNDSVFAVLRVDLSRVDIEPVVDRLRKYAHMLLTAPGDVAEAKTLDARINGAATLIKSWRAAFVKAGGRDVFVLLTSNAPEDVPIPGESYGFATLHRAQALGDFRSLSAKGRRVIRVHLGRDIEAGLQQLIECLA